MNADTLLRTAALLAAACLLAAPYWDVIGTYLAAAAKAADGYKLEAARFAAAALLIYAAYGCGFLPAVRQVTWNLANVVTAAKVVVGLAFVAKAFVEAAALAHRAIDSRVRPTP